MGTVRSVPEEQCATTTVPECHTINKDVPQQQCTVVNEQQCTSQQQCTTETHTVVDTATTQQCQDITREVCSHQQVSVQTHTNVIGHTVGAPIAATGHAIAGLIPSNAVAGHAVAGHAVAGHAVQVVKRDADADADADAGLLGGQLVAHHVAPATVSAPACHAVTERKCVDVPVQVPRAVSVPR